MWPLAVASIHGDCVCCAQNFNRDLSCSFFIATVTNGGFASLFSNHKNETELPVGAAMLHNQYMMLPAQCVCHRCLHVAVNLEFWTYTSLGQGFYNCLLFWRVWPCNKTFLHLSIIVSKYILMLAIGIIFALKIPDSLIYPGKLNFSWS